MAAGKSISDILAGAKNTLKSAQDFTKSAGGVPSSVAPQHEFSKAPYSMVKKPSVASEADSAGQGIKNRISMEQKAQKAIQ